MKKIFYTLLVTGILASSFNSAEAAIAHGGITGRTVVGGLLSLIIWPGIGQAINENPGEKVLTHAVVGLLPPFRFWSGYDALVDRQGGYWNGKI